MVVDTGLAQKAGHELVRCRRNLAALPVIPFQPARDNRLGNRLAAFAAHWSGSPVDFNVNAGRTANRLVAVITTQARVVARLHCELGWCGQLQAPALWLEAGIITQDQVLTTPAPWRTKSPINRMTNTMRYTKKRRW